MSAAADTPPGPGQPGGVQSIARVFALLEALADAGGVAGVSQLATISGLPLPTIHRLLRTLVALGYARQEPSREYALGPRLVPLGDAASRLVDAWAKPYLSRLAVAVGESANLALLDGAEVVYVAQAAARRSMRMFTEPGHRAGLHCTAVGKAILATLPPEKAARLVGQGEMRAYTERTITDVTVLMREVAAVGERGFATDLGEQEDGVCCVAVALPVSAPGAPARGAVSVSGPQPRMTEALVGRIVPALVETAGELARELDLVAR